MVEQWIGDAHHCLNRRPDRAVHLVDELLSQCCHQVLPVVRKLLEQIAHPVRRVLDLHSMEFLHQCQMQLNRCEAGVVWQASVDPVHHFDDVLG